MSSKKTVFPGYNWTPEELNEKIQHVFKCFIKWYYALADFGKDNLTQRKLCWKGFLKAFPNKELIQKIAKASKEAGQSYSEPPEFKRIQPPETHSGYLCYPAMENMFKTLNDEVYKYNEREDLKRYKWLREKFYNMYGLHPPPVGTGNSKKRYRKPQQKPSAEEKTKMFEEFKEML